ncbi:protein heat-stress-associated 32 [Tanacetum coccineum]
MSDKVVIFIGTRTMNGIGEHDAGFSARDEAIEEVDSTSDRLKLQRMGHIDVLIRRVERCLEAGADMISIDAEDVCRYADSVTADIIATVIGRLGLEKTMLEASNSKTSQR